MTLNHVNVAVTDVSAAVAFFEKYLGLRKTSMNSSMGFMVDDNGLLLALMKPKTGSVKYPGYFHLGFFIGDKAKVDELYETMRNEGLSVTAPVNAHTYTFYVDAPGGIRVEIGV